MLDHTIQKALRRAPEQRFQSVGTLRLALEAALNEPLVARTRRRRVAAVGAAVGLLAALGIVAVGVTHPSAVASARAEVEPWLARLAPAAAAAPAPVAVAVAATPAPPTALAAAAVPVASAVPAVEGAVANADEPPSADTDEDDADGAAVAENGEPGSAADATMAPEDDTEAAPGDEVAEAEPVGKTDPSAAPAEADPIAAQVVAATALLDEGRALKAYGELKRLAKRYPKDARVLAALSRAAAATKSWGDAYRAARRWVEIEPSATSRVELARMARAVGKRDEAVATLKAILAAEPDCAEARELLGRISPSAVVAMK